MLTSALLIALFAAKVADLPPGAVLRLGDTRWRAGGTVRELAFSPDGTRIVSVETHTLAEHNARVKVWDVKSGRPERLAEVNHALFAGLTWGPGGGFVVVKRVARVDGRDTLLGDDFRVWDFTDPRAVPPPLFRRGRGFAELLIVSPPATDPGFTEFALSGDGRRVAAARRSDGGSGNTIEVFELKSTETAERLMRVRSLPVGAIIQHSLMLSADGSTVVAYRAVRKQAVATAWDVKTGRVGPPITLPFRGQMALSPDGRVLVVPIADDGSRGFDRADLVTGEVRKLARWPTRPDEEEAEPSYGIAFFPSGKAFVFADGRTAVVLDVTSGKVLGRLGHACGLSAIAVSADGKQIATVSAGLIRLWDAATFRPLNQPTGHQGGVVHAELSPDGKRLLTLGGDETLRVWDMATGKEQRAFADLPWLIGNASTIAHEPTFTPDGLAVVFSKGERLVARDILTGLEVPLPGELAKQPPSLVAFAPDGKAVLTNFAGSHILEVWDWPSGKKRFTVEASGDPERPGFSPDGSVIFASAVTPERWDAKTGKALPPAWDAKKDADPFALLSLRPNPRLCTCYQDDRRQVVAAGTLKPVPAYSSLNIEDNSDLLVPQHAAFCPTGRQLAEPRETETGAWEVWVLEAATCRVRRTITGHRGEVQVLGFTPDGTKLLTAGGDHTVLVWDVRPQSMPLPDAVRRETDAAKLWATMSVGKADAAYLAMARLAAEPDAAVKTARLRIRPATATDPPDHAAQRLADGRAIELLESLGTAESRAFLKELAGGDAKAFRTQAARRALERVSTSGYNPR